ncbi:putative Sirtuin 5 [Hyaloraphidium curvatum]|nr:putative Sirtuin 5 [Hyaloraphidium curvatum]
MANSARARELLLSARNLVILTGAGVSAASGVPTFRGPGGLWRHFRSEELATPRAFAGDPSLVWEWYHWRRETVRTKLPNGAHLAIARLQSKPPANLLSAVLVTQNVDGIHPLAGSPCIEMHGSLFRTKCTNSRCPGSSKATEDRRSPIVEALRGRGAPDVEERGPQIPEEELPRCGECGSLTRPAVVWFGENLDPAVMASVQDALQACDLLFVVGTSGLVYPAAGFAEEVQARGGNVVEFNVERTRQDADPSRRGRGAYLFVEGPCEVTVPAVVNAALAR